MEATIVHEGGTAIVEGFTLIEEQESFDENHPDIRVWYGEPHDFENSRHDLYGNAAVAEVDATET